MNESLTFTCIFTETKAKCSTFFTSRFLNQTHQSPSDITWPAGAHRVLGILTEAGASMSRLSWSFRGQTTEMSLWKRTFHNNTWTPHTCCKFFIFSPFGASSCSLCADVIYGVYQDINRLHTSVHVSPCPLTSSFFHRSICRQRTVSNRKLFKSHKRVYETRLPTLLRSCLSAGFGTRITSSALSRSTVSLIWLFIDPTSERRRVPFYDTSCRAGGTLESDVQTVHRSMHLCWCILDTPTLPTLHRVRLGATQSLWEKALLHLTEQLVSLVHSFVYFRFHAVQQRIVGNWPTYIWK